MIINRKDAEDALALLTLWNIDQPEVSLNDLTADTVDGMYKRAARRCHPDVGGKPEEFVAVDRAKCLLIKWLERQEQSSTSELTAGLCKECKGRGFIKRQRGFSTLRQQCPACRGTGDENYDHDHNAGRSF